LSGRFRVLAHAKEMGTALYGPSFRSKSGLMLGLGETESELLTTFEALAKAKVDILTLGQLPAPHAPPAAREALCASGGIPALGAKAKALGFSTVYAGPLVRSSFNAHEVAGLEGISIA